MYGLAGTGHDALFDQVRYAAEDELRVDSQVASMGQEGRKGSRYRTRAHLQRVAILHEEGADVEAVRLVVRPPRDEGGDGVLDLDALQLVAAGGECAAKRERRLVMHANDDAIAVAHDANRILG